MNRNISKFLGVEKLLVYLLMIEVGFWSLGIILGDFIPPISETSKWFKASILIISLTPPPHIGIMAVIIILLYWKMNEVINALNKLGE